MYYCACNNIFFLFSHFFPFELNYRSRGILCEATIFLSCSSIQTTQRSFHERDLLFCGKFISPASNEAAFKREMNIRGDDFFTRRNLRSSNHANFLFIFIRLGKGMLKDKRETNNISLYLPLGRCLWGAFNFRPSSFLPTIRG